MEKIRIRVKEKMIMNFEEAKVVNADISFGKLTRYIDFVVANSFDKNGNYHAYLRDYAETIAIITMYTDYKLDNAVFSLDEVMKYRLSDEWDRLIEAIGNKYEVFHAYVENEINYINTPMRFADGTMKSLTSLIRKLEAVIEVIDIDKIKGYDFDKLLAAINAVISSDTKE
jgi:hypothetical protein